MNEPFLLSNLVELQDLDNKFYKLIDSKSNGENVINLKSLELNYKELSEKISENKEELSEFFLKKEDNEKNLSIKSINGGFLIQERDEINISQHELPIVTKKTLTKNLIDDMIFASKVAKYVKSNAIVFAKNKTSIGIGAGQMSRIDAAKLASKKTIEIGNYDLKNSVVASDAFLPFPDTLEHIPNPLKGLKECRRILKIGGVLIFTIPIIYQRLNKSRLNMKNSYHGSTHGSLNVSGYEKRKRRYRPLLPNIFQINFNSKNDLSIIDNDTACVIMEPIQGGAGFISANNEYLKEIRKICNQNNILMILDEVQCAYRTGNFFAFEKSGITPDIVPIAKGIGGGFPLGACLVNKKVSVGMTPGTHGSTFGGNPLAMAVGNAVLDVIFKKGFLENVKEKGKYFDQGLNKMKDKYPKIIAEIRGAGLIKGLKMLVDNTEFIKRLMNHKMLAIKAEENVVRLFPPLIVNNKELDEAIEKIDKVCKEMS